jgi:hypothetical protein
MRASESKEGVAEGLGDASSQFFGFEELLGPPDMPGSGQVIDYRRQGRGEGIPGQLFRQDDPEV